MDFRVLIKDMGLCFEVLPHGYTAKKRVPYKGKATYLRLVTSIRV